MAVEYKTRPSYDEYIDMFESRSDDERQGGPDEIDGRRQVDYPTYSPGEVYRYPRVLRRNNTGNDVRLLQSRLRIPIDGKFGPNTETAVKAFQAAHKLKADGIVGALTWSEALIEPLCYMQNDARWRSTTYSVSGDSKQTIGSSGCGPCCMTMVGNSYQNRIMLPPHVCSFALAHGYRTRHNGTSWGFFPHFARVNGMTCVATNNFKDVVDALLIDRLVIASMGPGYFTKGGHYILLWQVDPYSKLIFAMDPASRHRVKASFEIVRSQAKRFFVFDDDDLAN